MAGRGERSRRASGRASHEAPACPRLPLARPGDAEHAPRGTWPTGVPHPTMGCGCLSPRGTPSKPESAFRPLPPASLDRGGSRSAAVGDAHRPLRMTPMLPSFQPEQAGTALPAPSGGSPCQPPAALPSQRRKRKRGKRAKHPRGPRSVHLSVWEGGGERWSEHGHAQQAEYVNQDGFLPAREGPPSPPAVIFQGC